MHYPYWAFRKSGTTATITPVDGSGYTIYDLGTSDVLTEADKCTLNIMYPKT